MVSRRFSWWHVAALLVRARLEVHVASHTREVLAADWCKPVRLIRERVCEIVHARLKRPKLLLERLELLLDLLRTFPRCQLICTWRARRGRRERVALAPERVDLVPDICELVACSHELSHGAAGLLLGRECPARGDAVQKLA